ncbi:hypothetical protein BURKHO8Y_110305 [Burkholderia sp. 8Y]|nr:hypothetical protein BURKHO8Y_110305 [Burkholderia sp. 8Y]
MQTADRKTGAAQAQFTKRCAKAREDLGEKGARSRIPARKRTSVRFLLDQICWDMAAGRNFVLAVPRHRETFSTGARAAKNTVRPEFPLRFSVNQHAPAKRSAEK